MRIVFMGTPDFAVPSLQALIDAGHDVCAVYTQPDKPQGRKQILTAPPVKTLALAHDIPVFQPNTLKNEDEQARLRELAPEVIIVVAYGKLLPKAVLDIPPHGCINVHGSLLPRWRGAAPIQWRRVWTPAICCSPMRPRSVRRRPQANFLTAWHSPVRNF